MCFLSRDFDPSSLHSLVIDSLRVINRLAHSVIDYFSDHESNRTSHPQSKLDSESSSHAIANPVRNKDTNYESVSVAVPQSIAECFFHAFS